MTSPNNAIRLFEALNETRDRINPKVDQSDNLPIYYFSEHTANGLDSDERTNKGVACARSEIKQLTKIMGRYKSRRAPTPGAQFANDSILTAGQKMSANLSS